MKVSMNGLRRSLSRDIQQLRDIVGHVIAGDDYDEEALVEAMNDVIAQSNVLNCVFNEADPEFSDLSDVEVEPLEIV